MITEDYVSFETAKLLKEKGFPQEYDIYHSMVYNEEDYEDEYEVQRMVLETKLVKAGTLSSYPVGVPEPKCYCPTLQMAMKWLREVHNLSVEVYRTACGYIGCIVSIPSGTDVKFLEEDGDDLPSGTYTKWEYACEAAIKYCLDLTIL